MKKTLYSKQGVGKFKKFFASCSAVFILAGFMFSAPNPDFLNTLVRQQIEDIKESNEKAFASNSGFDFGNLDTENIAFAQEEYDPSNPYDNTSDTSGDNTGSGDISATYPICCSNGEQPDVDEYCDDNQCTPMCCPDGTNPNVGYRCDNTLASCGWTDPEQEEEEDPTIKEKVCTDVNATNYKDPSVAGREPGGICTYISACCDPQGLNFDATLCSDPHYVHDQDVCIDPNPICCNSGYDNYTEPSNRRPADVCDNSTCSCGSSGTHASGDHEGTQCPDDGDGNYCEINTGFSVIKSGVAISGSATTAVSDACGEEDVATQEAYLAGMAAADATPDTPLNTPIILDALSSYTVTSKDYCLNIAGTQGLEDGYNRSGEGICCSNGTVPNDETGECEMAPECGLSNGAQFESEPTSNLCQNGTPSGVATNTNSYDWTCSVANGGNAGEVQCSAIRTCNGQSCEPCTDLDCGPADQCKNVSGSQDGSYLSSNNVTPDGFGYCWNTTTGACGSISQIPYVTEVPSTNLCISGTDNSPVSIDDDTGIYSWNCTSIQNGNNINPTCQVRQCQGTECQTDQSTGLIDQFKAQPSIVSKIGDGCNLTWKSNIDSTITDPEQGCRINGNPVADNNLSGVRVGPGAYSLMCYQGVTFQIKSARCTISPDYKEI